MRQLKQFVAISCFFLGVATAQVTTSTIFGTVLDPSGAAVPGATVTVQNKETGLSRTVTSDKIGQYTLTFLPVGTYSLSASEAGFKTTKRTGIELSASQRVEFNVALEVGSSGEQVTVTSEAPLVNTTSAEQTSTVSTVQVRELPTSRRDWSSFLNLGAGISTTAISNKNAVVTMNGLPPSGFRFTVDGTDSEASTESPSLSMYQSFNYIKAVGLEAVSEVSVTKGIASAENANTMSGNINVITKSGTNEFHGSLFENNQIANLNARNYFLTSKVPSVFNQFGGSIGGPIIHNKLFFFGAYEGYRQSTFQSINGEVPTQEFRNDAIAAVPAYQDFFNIYPLPTAAVQPGDIVGFFQGAGHSVVHDDHVDVRVDYQASSRGLLTARYSRGRPFSQTPRVTDNPRDYTGVSEVGNLSYTYAGSVTSQTRFGYNLDDVLRLDEFYSRNVPGITCDCGFDDNGETFSTFGHTWSLEQVFSANHGRHALKWGALYLQRRSGRQNVQTPEIEYATAQDLINNTPSSATMTYGVNPFQIQEWQIGGFVQDDFRLRPSFTLNVGVRYDYFSVPHERDDRIFTRSAGGFGAFRPPDSMYDANYRNIAPRVGFAWSLGADQHTVIRGGAGFFYSPHSLTGAGVSLVQNSRDEPFRYTFSQAEIQNLGLAYPITNANTLQYVEDPNAPWSGDAVSTYYPNPYSIQWLISFEHMFGNSLSVETAYVGTRGIELNYSREENQVDPTTGQYPNPAFADFLYYDTSDHSQYESWQTTVRKRLSQNLFIDASYTLSRNMSFGTGDISVVGTGQLPQDPNNIAAEWGPTPYDARHRFVADFLYQLPFVQWANATSRGSKALLGGWQFGGIVSASSGTPLAISQSSTWTGSRPDYLGGPTILSNYRDTLQYLNLAAFAKVPTYSTGVPEHFGSLGRNAVRGPGLWNVDLALSKNFDVTERVKLQLRADMFDALNHTEFNSVVTDIKKKNFGQITGAANRIIQLNGRITF